MLEKEMPEDKQNRSAISRIGWQSVQLRLGILLKISSERVLLINFRQVMSTVKQRQHT
jgi:hypothetical protein